MPDFDDGNDSAMEVNRSQRRVVLSFDVEEHYRIEAASQLMISDESKRTYAWRMEATTRRILDLLAGAEAKATFFIVGEIAVSHPKLESVKLLTHRRRVVDRRG